MKIRENRVLIATTNLGKLEEFKRILETPRCTFVGLDEFPQIKFPPEGQSYFENARIKARTAARQTGLVSVADDSGLEVLALGGRPGPLSARYGGPGLSDFERSAFLLSELETLGSVSRLARFVCVAALAIPDGPSFTEKGICRGVLLQEASGTKGFGYDPLFVPEGHERSFAEFSKNEKNQISHRGIALRAISAYLRKESFLS